ncbi:MAG: transposase [Chlamydiota bacterium]
MVVTISKRAPWNLGKQMLQIFPEPCEKCGLNLSEMKIVLREYETINADAIIEFFKDLEAGKKEGKLHIILDNAAADRSRKVKEYLKTSRIKGHYLPPYSPNLNPIERLWKVFRELVLYNRYFESRQDFFEAVRSFFREKVHKIQKLLKARINDNFQVIKLNPIKLS